MVDSLGLVHALLVQPASVPDRTGGKMALRALGEQPRLKGVLADGGYSGRPMEDFARSLGYEIRFAGSLRGGFKVQPKRWIVERTLSWLVKCRRLRVDYDQLCQTGVAWVQAAMIRIMLAKLAGGR